MSRKRGGDMWAPSSEIWLQFVIAEIDTGMQVGTQHHMIIDLLITIMSNKHQTGFLGLKSAFNGRSTLNVVFSPRQALTYLGNWPFKDGL